jgi:hypothetical protein
VQYFEFYFLATNALCNTLIKIEKSKINILWHYCHAHINPLSHVMLSEMINLFHTFPIWCHGQLINFVDWNII